jgi:ribosomal protein L15E
MGNNPSAVAAREEAAEAVAMVVVVAENVTGKFNKRRFQNRNRPKRDGR